MGQPVDVLQKYLPVGNDISIASSEHSELGHAHGLGVADCSGLGDLLGRKDCAELGEWPALGVWDSSTLGHSRAENVASLVGYRECRLGDWLEFGLE